MKWKSLFQVFHSVLEVLTSILKMPFYFIKYMGIGLITVLQVIGQAIAIGAVWFYRGLVSFFDIFWEVFKQAGIYVFLVTKKVVELLLWFFKKMFQGIWIVANWLAKLLYYFFYYLGVGVLVFVRWTFRFLKRLGIGAGHFVRYFGYGIVATSRWFYRFLTYAWKGLHVAFDGFVVFLNYNLIGAYVTARVFIKTIEFLIKFTWFALKKLWWLVCYPFVSIWNNVQRIIQENRENQEQAKKVETAKEEIEQATETAKEAKRRERMEKAKMKKERRLYQRQLTPGHLSLMQRFKRFLGTLGIIKYIEKDNQDINSLMIEFNAEEKVNRGKPIIYQYLAKNSDGQLEKGTFQAFSKLDVHSYLLSEGYEIYKIETSWLIRMLNARVETKMKNKDLIFFLTQLNTYVKAGIPLVEAIKIISKQEKKKNKQNIYKAIIYELTMGESLSIAFEKQGKVFPKLLINMLKAAELAGNMTETLDDMINYYTAIDQTRKQMITAMIYPTTIFVFATIVVSYILIYVIPKFVVVFEDLQAELPPITVFILNISHFLERNLIWLILGIAIAILLAVTLYKKVKNFRYGVQWLAMHIPVMGNVIIYNEVTVFTKTFSSLLKHNVYITDSMEILNKITNNEIYKGLILDTITNLARGEKVSTAFKDKWCFPDIAYSMLVTGERTGQLGPMMERVALHFENEHRNAVARIKTLVEPVLIVTLAVVVGGILLAIVIPMFSMYQNIGM